MVDGEDDVLLRRLAVGDEAAFTLLYDRFAARLFRTAWALTGSREEAEDAVQEVFVALVHVGPRLSQVNDLPAYLFTALRRTALRRHTRRIRRPTQSLADVDVPARDIVGERDEKLEHALAALPDEQREVIVLKVDGGLTFAELGQVLNISANTAASRYRYALEKLRTALEGPHGTA